MSDSESNWEKVGRELLRGELETCGGEVQLALTNASRKLGDGEELTADDLQEMWVALNTAREAVRLAEAAAPVSTSRVDLTEILGDDDLKRRIMDKTTDKPGDNT